MDLAELFRRPGFGVLATAGPEGQVNSAVYARPRVLDAATLVWGMTDGRSWRNVARNPHAAYLYRLDAPGYQGVRLALEFLRAEEEGEMLAAIRQNTDAVVAPGAGAAVTRAVWFRVTEMRPLI